MNQRIDDLPARWGPRPDIGRLPAPGYQHDPSKTGNLMFAIESLARHMTDEGHQLQQGLRRGGYLLAGHRENPERPFLDIDSVNVKETVEFHVPFITGITTPNRVGTVVLQDKREWDSTRDGCYDPDAEFVESEYLATRPDIFKLTILKDAHQNQQYHADAAQEIGCHAWITYYHPAIVSRLASYVRPEHLVRTWHTIDPLDIPPYSPAGRCGVLLSGAINRRYYPLRQRIKRAINFLPHARMAEHPGYGASGARTPSYLKMLSRYRAAYCTASIFGYSLRKIVEATACGCVVITDLPVDDVVPDIDGNLVRVHPDVTINELAAVTAEVYDTYDPERQAEFAARAIRRFDYRVEGLRLAREIQTLRSRYG